MFQGKLVAIAVARQAKGPMENVAAAEAVVGQGLAGDRYGVGAGAAQFQRRRKPENEVTLIACEAIEAAAVEFNLPITHLDTRRNLLTESVPLNDLVGKTFRVGSVVLKGLELCEPCGYLERRTYPGIKEALKKRGGLRCCVMQGGELRTGDAIEAVPARAAGTF
jgi:MOSC domain-containing protein YiiM